MPTINSDCSRGEHRRFFLSCLASSSLFLLLITIFANVVNIPVKIQVSDLHSRRRLLQVVAGQYCDGTLYPDLCASMVSSIPDLHGKSLPEVIYYTVNSTAGAVRNAAKNFTDYIRRHDGHLDPRQCLALADCLELFAQTLDELEEASAGLADSDPAARADDVETVLSAAITNQDTCLDGFAYVDGGGYRPAIQRRLLHVSRLVSNSLAMMKRIRRRRRRGALEAVDAGGFPEWLSARDRRLLQAPAANATTLANTTTTTITPDLVVAKDGSGNFTTISDAVAAAPNNTAGRFVIYVKAGAYFENVEVGKSKANLMMIGDGIGKTVVKASRNVVDGWTTFRSATFAVVGNGFLMRDMTIENAAGPSKHQAVALRVSADLAVFYRCSFVGYQDTLYVHSLRQFYRDCDVYGTIDFVFGNAAVVLQGCNLYARRPLPNQQNIFTAQGREDPNQNTGISIHKCKVAAAADLIPVQANFSTFLGRPWKEYSRTVFMQSYLDSLIDPAGWTEWNGTFALATLYYGEYMNRGPGANTTNRVTWPGFTVIASAAEANNFTVAAFIQGDQWLDPTSVPITFGLN